VGKSRQNDNQSGYDVGMQGKAIPQIGDSIKANDVADGPFSLILKQVEKCVAAPMAVLYLLAGGE
jgi:hypothetical protein